MATQQYKIKRNVGMRIPKPNRKDVEWWEDEVHDLLEAIGKSYAWHAGARYREHEKAIVGDISPQAALQRVIDSLRNTWEKKSKDAASRISRLFLARVTRRNVAFLESEEKRLGYSLFWGNNRHYNTVYASLVRENARLITQLSDGLLDQAEGIIWRGVTNGTDLSTIKEELVSQIGIEDRRAERIAIDQANKATVGLANARAEASGLIFGIWRHNNGGSKTFRDGVHSKQNHVALDGEIFILSEGLIDEPGGTEKIKPSQRVSCKCDYSVILRGTPEWNMALEKFPQYADEAA